MSPYITIDLMNKSHDAEYFLKLQYISDSKCKAAAGYGGAIIEYIFNISNISDMILSTEIWAVP